MGAPRGIYDGLLANPLDLVPGSLFSMLVLRVHRQIWFLAVGVEPKLDHLPIALVESRLDQRTDQVVVVVEVEEPVGEP